MKTARGDKKNFFGYCRSQNLREMLSKFVMRGLILCTSDEAPCLQSDVTERTSASRTPVRWVATASEPEGDTNERRWKHRQLSGGVPVCDFWAR